MGFPAHRQAAGLVVGWAFLPTIMNDMISGSLKLNENAWATSCPPYAIIFSGCLKMSKNLFRRQKQLICRIVGLIVE
ncbi:MAG: hypothetical protein IKX14_08285, partial [Neisseriaceae bacterium]|nr:hypothetical protein [Neisseriaceae bacterium]